MPLDDYEELRTLVTPLPSGLGARIEGAIGYVSAQKFGPVYERTDPQGNRRFEGKISRNAFAAIIDGVVLTGGHCVYDGEVPPPCIAAHTIVYRCSIKPDRPTEFRRTGGHNGNYCRIERNVLCYVLHPNGYAASIPPIPLPDDAPEDVEQ